MLRESLSINTDYLYIPGRSTSFGGNISDVTKILRHISIFSANSHEFIWSDWR